MIDPTRHQPHRRAATRRHAAAALLVLLVAACGGGDSAGPEPGPTPNPVVADTLTGALAAPAVAAIEREPFVPVRAEYRTGHPQLPGMAISVSTLVVSLDPAATVGEVNALLRRVGATVVGGLPGKAGEAPGLLALRLPTITHAGMDSALAALRASPRVRRASADILLETFATTRADAPGWGWEREGQTVPSLSTWGLIAMRMPQAWNLNAQIVARGAPAVRTGVLDEGFAITHPDLAPAVAQVLATAPEPVPVEKQGHGTHVAGTIAAAFNNGRDIDGVNPFARLVLRQEDRGTSSLATALWGLDALITDGQPLRVVNVSLGYNWRLRDNRTRHDPRLPGGEPQRRATDDGALVRDALAALARDGVPLPFIVVAAGNDGEVFPGAPARYNSPFAAAALVHGVAAITVVEADDVAGTATAPTYTRRLSSSVGGHLSAPGGDIMSLAPGGLVDVRSGTSMAAPHVAGLAGFLYALAPGLPAPTLDANPLRDLLVATTRRPAPDPFNGRPHVDAFAAALQLDVLLGTERVLTWLLDVDDGSDDGNQRLLPGSGAIATSENLTEDATIDMADFRRWRDWALQLAGSPAPALDGPADHPKKDVNADGVVGSRAEEARFPRGDFNGDGKLSLNPADRAVVPGVLADRGPLSDLEVLKARFRDPHYAADQLDTLITTADLTLDLRTCQQIVGAIGLQVEVREGEDLPLIQGRDVAVTAPERQILTVPVGQGRSLDVRVRVVGAADALLTRDTSVVLSPGGDLFWRPACGELTVRGYVGPMTTSSRVQTSVTIGFPSAPVEQTVSGFGFFWVMSDGERVKVWGPFLARADTPPRTGVVADFVRRCGNFGDDRTANPLPGTFNSMVAQTGGGCSPTMTRPSLRGDVSRTTPPGGRDIRSWSGSLRDSSLSLRIVEDRILLPSTEVQFSGFQQFDLLVTRIFTGEWR